MIKTGNAIRQPYFTTINSIEIRFQICRIEWHPKLLNTYFKRARSYRMTVYFPSSSLSPMLRPKCCSWRKSEIDVLRRSARSQFASRSRGNMLTVFRTVLSMYIALWSSWQKLERIIPRTTCASCRLWRLVLSVVADDDEPDDDWWKSAYSICREEEMRKVG